MDGVVHREAGPDTWGTWNLYSEGVCFQLIVRVTGRGWGGKEGVWLLGELK